MKNEDYLLDAYQVIKLDCKCFEDLALEQEIKITEKKETGHNEMTYNATTKDGRNVNVVEKSSIYDVDAYCTELWVFNE